MAYYLFLSLRYRRAHPVQTMYSLLAIMLSVVLCYGSISVSMTILNYGYESAMQYRHGCELQIDEFPVGQGSIDGDEEWTPKQYYAMQKKLEGLPDVKRTYLKKKYVEKELTEEEAQKGQIASGEKKLYLQLYMKVKDPSDLQGCADRIEKATGYQVSVDPDIAAHLGQGNDMDSVTQAAGNAMVALIGAVFACFVMLVIRNTMMLPILERMKEYGILRCVGLSDAGLYCMLGAEGILLTLISTVFGTALGFGILKLSEGWINECLMPEVAIVFRFYPLAVLYSCLLCIGVTLFALLEPARQTVGMSVQEVLRGGAYGIHSQSGKTKKRKEKKHLLSRAMGRVLGLEWEYAIRNMLRNPGGQIYLCIGVTISMFLFSVVSSGIESVYATYDNSMEGKHQEYTECIFIRGKYETEQAKRIVQDVLKLSGVQKAGILLAGDLYTSNTEITGHIRDFDGTFADIEEIGYDRKHLQTLRKQLVSGRINYDQLVQKQGVVLCDYQYNVKDAEGNVTKKDVRYTDYKVGDTVPLLSPKALKEVKQTYEKVMEKLDKKYGEMPEDAGTKESRRYWKGCQRLLKKAGYDITPYKDRGYLKNGVGPLGIKIAMQQCRIDQGDVVRLPILAIIKEDSYNSLAVQNTAADPIEFIMADQTMLQWGISSSEWIIGDAPYGSCKKGVGFVRDARKAKGDVAEYVKKLNDGSKYTTYTQVSLAEDWYNSEDYTDPLTSNSRQLDLVRKSGLFVGGLILLICLLQIFNITSANMTMRRQELYLLKVTGMSRGQMQKMILLEKGITCMIGLLLGIALGYAMSHFMIASILSQDGGIADDQGGIQYVWPIGKIFVVAAVVYLLCLVAGRGRLVKENTSGK